MEGAFDYCVRPDPGGMGWIVTATGYVTRSLPYDSKEEAIRVAEDLVSKHPHSTLVVTDEPPPLTSFEREHRMAA